MNQIRQSKNKFTIKNNMILITGTLRDVLGLNAHQIYSISFTDSELVLTEIPNNSIGLKFKDNNYSLKMSIKPEYIPTKWQLIFEQENKVEYQIEEGKIIIKLPSKKSAKSN